MRRTWTTAGLVAAMTAIGAPGAAAAPPDQPELEVLRFVDISRPIGPPASEGDALRFNNLLRHVDRGDAVTRQVLGRFPSTCTPTEGTRYECEGTLELRDGSMDVTGTPDLAASSPIDMVVTGGTGRYATVTGSARLTPTGAPGTSLLDVTLVRPAP
jgi:hypothetical protein